MTNRKNWIRLITIFLFSLLMSFILFSTPYFDIEVFKELGENFHYNAISMSAIIGGFLFTGISILISVIDKERINRLWENNYLDNLYRAAFVGMIANVITIIIAFLLIFLSINEKIRSGLIKAELTTLIVGLIFFSWCIKQLIVVMTKLKKKK